MEILTKNRAWFWLWLVALAMAFSQIAKAQEVLDPSPNAKDWANLSKLPDWGGTWNPSLRVQNEEIAKHPTPWTPKAAKQIAQMVANEKAGHPRGIFVNCLPQGMPSWMLITHNAIEFLFTPGRVTILGEGDGNRLRRIYTDGRAHPEDPDLTYFGHSIGHWEGDTLVVDTVGIRPQAYIALTEGVGIPNNGDMHIVERIHLSGADMLEDDLEITAPHVLTATWKTSRFYYRQRARKFEIVEGVCLDGSFDEATDKDGNSVLVPARPERGTSKP
jgi:hypothetical protein